MNSIAIMYHDIVTGDAFDKSGFPGKSSALYKLDIQKFDDQMRLISEIIEDKDKEEIYLTFDDGGISFLNITEILTKYGLKGYFFITTKYIGSDSFLTSAQILELSNNGHVIGSHSHSHPSRMSKCSLNEMREEWTQSKLILEDIVGKKVDYASVPGGYYSPTVGRSASDSGFLYLFTSEPIVGSTMIDNCVIKGRYTVWRETSTDEVLRIVKREMLPRWKQYLMWNTKKVIKAIGGNVYLNIRERLINK